MGTLQPGTPRRRYVAGEDPARHERYSTKGHTQEEFFSCLETLAADWAQ